MAQSSNPGAVVVLLILLFFLFQPSAPPISTVDEHSAFEAVLIAEHAALDLLRNSSLGDFAPLYGNDSRWLNLTGLRQGDGFQWALLPEAQKRARDRLDYVAGEEGLNILDGRTNGSLLLYHNVTGYVRGQWVQSELQGNRSPGVNLSAIVPNVEYFDQTWGRNISGKEGKVSLRFNERLPRTEDDLDGNTQPIAARLTIQDETSTGDGWAMKLHGVHHVDSGSIILATTSEKFAGIWALPHFALSTRSFDGAKDLLNTTIQRAIEAQEKRSRVAYEWNPWRSSISEDTPSQPMCEFIVYMQQQPLGGDVQRSGDNSTSQEFQGLLDLENDLRFPAGLHHASVPKLTMSMTVFSPDCGFVLESKGLPESDAPHLQGPKAEVYVKETKNVMFFFMLVYAAQLVLLSLQMKASSTPSTRGRISYTTLSMLNMGSGFAAFGFLMLSSVIDSVFLDSMILAFLAFLDGNYIGMRFVLDVWTAQEPERLDVLRIQQREQDAAYARYLARLAELQIAHPNVVPGEFGLPLPVTAARPGDAAPQPATTPGQTAPLRAAPRPVSMPTQLPRLRPPTFGSVYARFSILLLVLVFISLSAFTIWPIPARTFYANVLVLAYLSLWLPQIYRNIIRNTRKPLLWRFVIGQSLLRLGPIFYFWCVEDNVLSSETARSTFIFFIGWSGVQILVLGSQSLLGPRWFVNEKWAWVPDVWNWRPVLRDGDEEAALLPVGGTVVAATDNLTHGGDVDETADEGGERTTLIATTIGIGTKDRIYDCAICMAAVRVPLVASVPRSESGHSRSGSGNTSIRPGRQGDGTRAWTMLWRRVLDKALRTQRTDNAALSEDDYAITPCRHVFHGQCIASWLQYRTACPICRESLPSM